MGKLLYLQASPRGQRSRSIAVADAFVESYRQAHGGDTVVTTNVFETDLIPFDGLAVQAKYTILHGEQHTDEELAAWKVVETLIEEFASADKYVLAVPMWNFGIPYRLKQYIDLVVQPGYTFSYSPEEGYTGLLTGKRACLAYARGGDYSAPEMQSLDHQRSYLELVLGFMGITDLRSVVLEPALMGGPDLAAERLRAALEEARKLASDF